jgi:hypothetical protein
MWNGLSGRNDTDGFLFSNGIDNVQDRPDGKTDRCPSVFAVILSPIVGLDAPVVMENEGSIFECDTVIFLG